MLHKFMGKNGRLSTTLQTMKISRSVFLFIPIDTLDETTTHLEFSVVWVFVINSLFYFRPLLTNE